MDKIPDFDSRQDFENFIEEVRMIAHDLSNRLAVIRWRCEMATSSLEEGNPALKDLEFIEQSSSAALDLVKDLRSLYHARIPVVETFDLSAMIKSFEPMIKRIAGHDVQLELVLANDLHPVELDKNRLEQVIAMLAIICRDAMVDGGKLRIKTSNVLVDNNGSKKDENNKQDKYVELQFSDTSKGMTEEEVSHLIHFGALPGWMSTGSDPDVKGMMSFVENSKGFLQVNSGDGEGIHWSLFFPASNKN